ncbi:lysophosphatidic acid receptor 6a isoform X2 [Phyllopteryx taeniolatus]|uniref:lysophosphatidic acid receptor 6a isoform X2 n=1 Tax=Phyllopteryx taeniolatus TaxID=161469 RepID=UPI002AD26198|nr:lysophosphatidic acid receptor 6a isoform X2 [Phyllopteryx taeniolatus]
MMFNNIPSLGSGNISAGNWSCSKNDGFKYPLYSTVFSIVFVVGLITNVVAIYIFTCSLKLRNETTTYMMNLVASDLLFVFTLPLRVFYFINRSWPFGSVLCKLSVSLFYTNMYGSILFLTCISVDRFLAIVHPFRSRTLRTKRNAKLVCAGVWVLVLSVSLTTGFLLDTTSRQRHPANATFCFENFSSSQWKSHLSKVVIFIETVGFVIPLLLNAGCSVRVLQTLRRPHKTLKGCFAESVVHTIYPVALCIAVSNCCFDPIVYYFTSETIQNSIKRKSLAGRPCDPKLSEALQSESSSNLQCSLRNLKAKMLHNESTV